MKLTRRRGVSACWCAHAVLVSAIALVGRGQAAAQPAPAGDYQPFPLQHAAAGDMERLLSATLPQLGETARVVADTRNNQVLVQGSPRAQQLARQLIESFDKPKPAPQPAAAASEPPVLRLYPMGAADQERAVARLRALFPDEKLVRIAPEPSTQQLIVVAPAGLQPRIVSLLNQGLATSGGVPGEGARTPPAAGPSAAASEPPISEIVVRLVNCPASQIETSLLRILGPRLEPQRVAQPQGPARYRLQDPGGQATELTLDSLNSVILVRGRTEVARQMVRLVQALDAPQAAPGRLTRIVPFRAADPIKVKHALDAYRGQPIPAPAANPAGEPPPRGESPGAAPPQPAPQQQSRSRNESGVALVGYIFQAGEAPPGGAGPAPAAGPAPPEDKAVTEERLRQMGIDVDVETLPELDIVILRGREKDVEELARIIEELERLSVEAEPSIEVYPLKHVKARTLATLITQVSQNLVGGRQGRVNVTSLEKPNALLLIGWGEALSTIKKLIRKLDQPVDPETQLQVFALKHAPAQQAAQTVQQFFANRPGLGPSVTVQSDTRTNALIVQAAPRDLEEVALLIERLDTAQGNAVNRARVFKIKNVLASELASTLRDAIQGARGGTAGQRSAILEFLSVDAEGQRMLRSGILTDVQITPDERNNTLLVTAPAESMDLLAALIEQLDLPVAVAQIKVFRVMNADANSLVLMLRSLFPAETGAAQGPSLAGAEGETSLVPLRFSVDSRSNCIIATGSEGDLKIIEALLLRLDEKGLEERKNQVYRLKNSPALDVATAVNEFLRSQRIVEQAAPGVVSPFQRIQSEVVVVPEPISNSLILSATPRYFDEVAKLIEDLDKEPPQVMIQVLLAEVELDNTDEFGVELGLQDSILFDRGLLGNLLTTTRTDTFSTPSGIVTSTEQVIRSATYEPGYNWNTTPLPPLPNSGSDKSLATSGLVAPQGVTNFAVGRVNNQLGFGGLVLSASSESVSVLIRALQESRRLDILSRPQIRTLDNQSAYIQIGEQVPYITQSTVTTGGNISNSIAILDVGLILGVIPRISPEGLIVMEVDATKSEVGPDVEGIPISVSQGGSVIRAPRIKTTRAQATVSASDGETIILGGLISKNSTAVDRKVPFLSDVPILGQLFRYDARIGERKELLIILTPYIINGPEDNERIRQLEAARMSWCCADVHAIHGVKELCNLNDCPICRSDVPVIYPDFDPRGTRIQQPGQGANPQAPEEVPNPAPPNGPAGAPGAMGPESAGPPSGYAPPAPGTPQFPSQPPLASPANGPLPAAESPAPIYPLPPTGQPR